MLESILWENKCGGDVKLEERQLRHCTTVTLQVLWSENVVRRRIHFHFVHFPQRYTIFWRPPHRIMQCLCCGVIIDSTRSIHPFNKLSCLHWDHSASPWAFFKRTQCMSAFIISTLTLTWIINRRGMPSKTGGHSLYQMSNTLFTTYLAFTWLANTLYEW